MRRAAVLLAIAAGLAVGNKIVHIARSADGASPDVATVIRSSVDDLSHETPDRLLESIRGVVRQVGRPRPEGPQSVKGEVSFDGSAPVPIDMEEQ